jgi:polygalacturonase
MSGGHLILGVEVSNVSITGQGRIDGNSDAFMLDKNGKPWSEKSKIPVRPSQMIWFVDSKDIKVSDVEIADAPYWSLFFLNCENVSVEGCYVHTIRKEYHTFNGDGIDIDRCRNVTVSNCRVDTSDDCITLRASTAHRLQNPMDCEMVNVTNCSLSSSCNAIRLGVGEGNIHDAVFSDITITDTKQAFNIVGAYVKGNRGTDIYGISFNNIEVEAKELVRIHHMYSPEAKIRDIVFDGISGTAPDVSHIWAKQAAPFKNIVFRNVDVSALVECVNAEVTIDGGLFRKKTLSSKELQDRINNIENNKNLLH